MLWTSIDDHGSHTGDAVGGADSAVGHDIDSALRNSGGGCGACAGVYHTDGCRLFRPTLVRLDLPLPAGAHFVWPTPIDAVLHGGDGLEQIISQRQTLGLRELLEADQSAPRGDRCALSSR